MSDKNTATNTGDARDKVIASAVDGLGISEREMERAAELLKDEDRQHAENLVRALGLEAPRILFAEMVRNGSGSEEEKRALLDGGTRMSKITESCGMELNAKGRKFKLTLGPCGADHDTTAEIANISKYLTKEENEQVIKEMSYIIFCARSVYNTMAAENKALWESAGKYLSRMDANQSMMGLNVDIVNTTLYISKEWKRVGLFLREDM
jgi:hypothetical protein